MEQQIVDTVQLAGTVSHDLSAWGLFWAAHWVVKLVMLMLIAASVWCWAIIFEKIAKVRSLNRKAKKFEEVFWSGNSLDNLFDRVAKKPTDPMSSVFVSGMREWRAAAEAQGGTHMQASVQQRVERAMHNAIGREMGGVEKSMTVLATVGSTAPFLGLFGTVWGIMNSFTSIAASNNTSLAVVAPGIAEALFATALGLVAAIPAVVAYNKFSNDLGRYGERLEAFSSDFISILSRYIEEHQEK